MQQKLEVGTINTTDAFTLSSTTLSPRHNKGVAKDLSCQ